MLDDPARIDAHVVGHHVARQADAARPGPVAQGRVRALATEVVGDPVVVERVGRRDGVGVAAHPLDPLGRLERSHSPMSQRPVTPHRASVSSSSSGIASSVRMSRPYARDSWSSQTYVLLAMSTTRGIQAESDEKASGSSALPSFGTSPRLGPPPPKRRWSARSSSAMTPSARSIRAMSAASASPRMPDHCSRMYRSCPASEVGEWRAGARSSSMSDWPSGPIRGPSAKATSSPAMASR